MAKVDVVMPKMGESITEGTVISWYKQPGDSIDLDETLLEIGTDKVDTEVPSPSAGVLAEILVQEGDTVEVGTRIAVIETDVNVSVDTAPPADPPQQETPVEAAAETAPAAPSPAAPAASANAVEVVMPKMGESIVEGTILSWHKQVGDKIEMDETLLEIATDKVDTEVPAPAAGTILEILVPEGETVEVGTPIARIGSGDVVATPASAPVAPAADEPTIATSTPVPSGDGAPSIVVGSTSIPRQGPGGKFYSPLVRAIAEKEGVTIGELEAIGGSGKEGRVTKTDLLSYVSSRSSSPVLAPSSPAAQVTATKPAGTVVATHDGRVEVVKMDRMRQLIAQHMSDSKKTSAHVTSFAEADVTNLVRLRESRKQAFLEREGVKLTYTPFFVFAAVEALRDHPVVNSSVDGTNIILKKDYHIGIAVAIDKSGLVVPVIKSAGHKNIAGIAKSAAELAHRARNKQLQPDDLQGGTFTVTNVGSLGSIMGTPIIAQPQVAILATGAIKKRPVVIEDPELGDVIGIRHMMYVSMSYDHRIIDGAMASSYLHRFVQEIEGFGPETEL